MAPHEGRRQWHSAHSELAVRHAAIAKGCSKSWWTVLRSYIPEARGKTAGKQGARVGGACSISAAVVKNIYAQMQKHHEVLRRPSDHPSHCPLGAKVALMSLPGLPIRTGWVVCALKLHLSNAGKSTWALIIGRFMSAVSALRATLSFTWPLAMPAAGTACRRAVRRPCHLCVRLPLAQVLLASACICDCRLHRSPSLRSTRNSYHCRRLQV